MPLPKRSLTSAQLARISTEAFAPTTPELFGVELEWPVHRHDDLGRPNLDAVAQFDGMTLPAGGRVTFEPGGQVELSTAPAPSMAAALSAATADAAALAAHLHQAGLRCETLAVDLRRPPQRILHRPRYEAMERYFAASGSAGTWMMCNTASTQVNLSHDAEDPHSRWYTMHRIAPVLVAMFANSPGRDPAGRRWMSQRQAIWASIDPLRTRPVDLDLPPERAWRDYALAAHVMFIPGGIPGGIPGEIAGGTAVPPGLPFGRWMHDGHDSGWPTAEDYRYHLTTLFPPVRPRGWLELRVLDTLPTRLRDAAALTVAAACSRPAQRELAARLPETRGLWTVAARSGLRHPVLAHAARTLIDVAADHLAGVSDDPGHADLLADFAARYTRAGLSPAAASSAAVKSALRRRRDVRSAPAGS